MEKPTNPNEKLLYTILSWFEFYQCKFYAISDLNLGLWSFHPSY